MTTAQIEMTPDVADLLDRVTVYNADDEEIEGYADCYLAIRSDLDGTSIDDYRVEWRDLRGYAQDVLEVPR